MVLEVILRVLETITCALNTIQYTRREEVEVSVSNSPTILFKLLEGMPGSVAVLVQATFAPV